MNGILGIHTVMVVLGWTSVVSGGGLMGSPAHRVTAAPSRTLLVSSAHPGAAELAVPAQLAERLRRAPARIELELGQAGRVIEIEVDDDTREEDEIEGRIVSLDEATRTVEIEHLGRVYLGETRRFELRGGRRVGLDEGMAEVRRALAAGESVGVEAEGVFREDGLSASKIKLEHTFKVEVKATIGPKDFDATTATLRLGGISYSLHGVPIEFDD